MKRVIIVQARMTSTRLPGKVLMDLEGRPMLARQLERLKRCRNIDEICIATTTNTADAPLVQLAEREGVSVFRGDEHDVLSRYVGAMIEYKADVIIRVTADCPLIDPEVTDAVIARAFEPDRACDYVSNVVPRSYPRGLDTEVFFADTLLRVERLATSKPAREHVTWFIHTERPDLFVRRQVVGERDYSDMRWTVDTEVDLATVRAIYSGAELSRHHLCFGDLADFVRRNPQLVQNQDVKQKSL